MVLHHQHKITHGQPMNITLPDLPQGWALAAIISIGEEWQVNLRDDTHVASATGATPAEACEAAINKVFDNVFVGIIYHRVDLKPTLDHNDILRSLGVRPPAPMKRRSFT
jgi:hypothetical protein